MTENTPTPFRGHAGRPFLLRFVVLTAVFYGFAWTSVYRDHVLPVVAGVQAQVSGVLLSLLGEANVVEGAVGRGLGEAAGVALVIKEGCDATEATALLIAACLAFPAPWANRLRGVAYGISLIFVLNVARVVTLFFISHYARDWFHTAHVDVWPALILLDAVLLWVLWARSARRVRPAPA
jgi:exosortase H (IPTLxxWG-CTERM-specific)